MRRFVPLLMVLLLVSACDTDQPPQSDREPPMPLHALEQGWVLQRDVLGGYSIQVRDSWSLSSFKQVAAPVESHYLDISSRPFEHGDYCAPSGPLSFVEPDGMFIRMFAVNNEHYFKSDDPARQEPGGLHFDRKTLASYEGTGCHPMYRMIFRLSGADISVQVAVGKATPKSLLHDVLAALNSVSTSN